MFAGLLARLGFSPPLPPVPTTDDPPSVRRARSVVGQGRYRLGAGGRDPLAPTPFDREGRADCSGYLSWTLGLDRKTDRIGGGWISTDSIVRDATGPRRMFDLVPVNAAVQPGDVIVYPGRYVAGRRVAIGHVGIVASVPPGWAYAAPADLAALRVVHCAASGRVAVRESDGRAWARRGIVARLK